MVKKIKPVSRQVKIQTEVDRIQLDRVVRGDSVPRIDEFWLPAVDVVEKAGEIVIEAEIPGVSQADITISVQSNRVEIKGAKKEPAPAGKAKYLRLEREFGRFRRLIALPCTVVPDQARAFLDNGVLVIVLVRYQPAETTGIDIQTLKKDE
jgi:HSP20 family protein